MGTVTFVDAEQLDDPAILDIYHNGVLVAKNTEFINFIGTAVSGVVIETSGIRISLAGEVTENTLLITDKTNVDNIVLADHVDDRVIHNNQCDGFFQNFFAVNGDLVSGILWKDSSMATKKEEYEYIYNVQNVVISGIRTIYETDGATVDKIVTSIYSYTPQFDPTGIRVVIT